MFDFVKDIEQAERSIGAGYKERMAAMAYALSLAQQALEQVEYVDFASWTVNGVPQAACAWCNRKGHYRHADHCLRQRALEAIERVEEME